jgi:hypothetical protein
MRDHEADAVAPFEDQRVELPARAAATTDGLRRDALRVLDREVVEIVGNQEIGARGDRGGQDARILHILHRKGSAALGQEVRIESQRSGLHDPNQRGGIG